MKAKLFVRGMKEPVELEADEATAAQNLIADATKDTKTPFSIEGVWSGTKAEMKFVVFPKKDEPDQYQGKVEPYSKAEAEAFEAEYQPFVEKAKAEGYKMKDGELFWLEHIKAVRLERLELPSGKSLQVYVRPGPYQEAMARKERFDAYKDRVAYAKNAEMQELEKMAAQVGENMTVLPEAPAV